MKGGYINEDRFKYLNTGVDATFIEKIIKKRKDEEEAAHANTFQYYHSVY